MSDTEWYYSDAAGEQAGPASTAALRELFASGTVQLDTFVWCDGQADWAEIADLPALKVSAVRRTRPHKQCSSRRSDRAKSLTGPRAALS